MFSYAWAANICKLQWRAVGPSPSTRGRWTILPLRWRKHQAIGLSFGMDELEVPERTPQLSMGYPLLCQKQHHLGQQVGSSSHSLTVGEAYDVCKVYPQMSGTPMNFQGNIRKVSIYLYNYTYIYIDMCVIIYKLSNLNITQAFIMREINTVPTTSSCWWSQTCFMISNICAVLPKM